MIERGTLWSIPVAPSNDLDELRAQLATTPVADAAAFIEIACALIIALVDELEDAEADQVLDRVLSRIGDQRSQSRSAGSSH